MKARNANRNKIISNLINHPKWHKQFIFIQPNKNIKPSWFGMPMLINKKYKNKKNKFLKYLTKMGIENRPIISGNFLNQPAAKLYKFNHNLKKFKNSQEIEKRGFFIGLHTHAIKKNTIEFLTSAMLNFSSFE